MFPTRKPTLTLHVHGTAIRTAADHPFFVAGRGWTNADDLHVGDQLLAHDGQQGTIEAITHDSDEAVVYQMDAAVPPFPCTGLMPAGTMIETADGLKKIEDITLGDRIVVRDRLDPERN